MDLRLGNTGSQRYVGSQAFYIDRVQAFTGADDEVLGHRIDVIQTERDLAGPQSVHALLQAVGHDRGDDPGIDQELEVDSESPAHARRIAQRRTLRVEFTVKRGQTEAIIGAFRLEATAVDEGQQ